MKGIVLHNLSRCNKLHVNDILSRNKLYISRQETGLHINSLIYNIQYKEIETDLEYRKKLEEISIEELYKMAEKIDQQAVEKIKLN